MAHHNKDKIKYKAEFCDKLIAHMKNGGTIDSFGGTIGVRKSTVYVWMQKYPDFDLAADIGKQLAQFWLEKRAQLKISGQEVEGIDSSKICPRTLNFLMATRFKETYGNVQVIDHRSSDGSMTPAMTDEERKKRIAENLKKLKLLDD